MEQYFKKYRNNALTYGILLIIFFSLGLVLLLTKGWFTQNEFRFFLFSFIFTLVIVIHSIKTNYLKFKNKIVTWEKIEEFLESTDEKPFVCLGIDSHPSSGLEYFEHDVLLEIHGMEIKIVGVSPVYSKKIVDTADKSPDKLFRMWVRYGPKKGEHYNSELVIEPA